MILDIQRQPSDELLSRAGLQVYEQRRMESIIPDTSVEVQLKLEVWLEELAALMRQLLLAKGMKLVCLTEHKAGSAISTAGC